MKLTRSRLLAEELKSFVSVAATGSTLRITTSVSVSATWAYHFTATPAGPRHGALEGHLGR